MNTSEEVPSEHGIVNACTLEPLEVVESPSFKPFLLQ